VSDDNKNPVSVLLRFRIAPGQILSMADVTFEILDEAEADRHLGPARTLLAQHIELHIDASDLRLRGTVTGLSWPKDRRESPSVRFDEDGTEPQTRSIPVIVTRLETVPAPE
jgi:hypothetical protein